MSWTNFPISFHALVVLLLVLLGVAAETNGELGEGRELLGYSWRAWFCLLQTCTHPHLVASSALSLLQLFQNHLEICLFFRTGTVQNSLMNCGVVKRSSIAFLFFFLGYQIINFLCSALSEQPSMMLTWAVVTHWEWSLLFHWLFYSTVSHCSFPNVCEHDSEKFYILCRHKYSLYFLSEVQKKKKENCRSINRLSSVAVNLVRISQIILGVCLPALQNIQKDIFFL